MNDLLFPFEPLRPPFGPFGLLRTSPGRASAQLTANAALCPLSGKYPLMQTWRLLAVVSHKRGYREIDSSKQGQAWLIRVTPAPEIYPLKREKDG